MEYVCLGCEWTDTSLSYVFQDRERLLLFLMSHKLVGGTSTCPTCHLHIPLDRRNLTFKCHNAGRTFRCKTEINALNDTFLQQSHLKFETFIRLIYEFVSPMRNTSQVAQQLKISQKTVVDWFSFCREVLMYYCIVNSERLGGSKDIVEVYEAKLGKKYTKGRDSKKKWLIGGVQRDTKKVFLETVDDCTEDCLIKTIKKYVLPETTIITDSWSSFKTLWSHGYTHKKLNNTDNYVDPDTGGYNIPIINKYWKTVKGQGKEVTRGQYFDTYVAELLFKKMYIKQSERFHHFLLLAGQLYTPGFSRNQGKNEEWMSLPKRNDVILVNSQDNWLVKPPVHHIKEEDDPEKTCFGVMDIEDIKKESPEVKEEVAEVGRKEDPEFEKENLAVEIKEENVEVEINKENTEFEIKDESLEIEIKEENVEVLTEEEIKKKIEEEKPLEEVGAMSVKDSEVACDQDRMKESSALLRKRRGAPEKAVGSAELDRTTVTTMSSREPNQNVTENIGVNQNGLPRSVENRLMHEGDIPQRNARRTPEEESGSTVKKRTVVTARTYCEPYRNMGKNISFCKTYFPHRSKRKHPYILPKISQLPPRDMQLSSRDTQLSSRDIGVFVNEHKDKQEKCLDTKVDQIRLFPGVKRKQGCKTLLPKPPPQLRKKNKDIFTSEQEEDLVKCCKKANILFNGLMFQDARKLVYNFAARRNIKCSPKWNKSGLADACWLKKFFKKHPSIALKNPKDDDLLNISDINCILDTMPKLINVTITTKDKSKDCTVNHFFKDCSERFIESLELERDHSYAIQDNIYQLNAAKKNVGYARRNGLSSDTEENKQQSNNLLSVPSYEGEGSGNSIDSQSGSNVRTNVLMKMEGATKDKVCRVVGGGSKVCEVRHEWLFSKKPEIEKEDDDLLDIPALDEDSERFNDNESVRETVFVNVEEDIFTRKKSAYY